MSSIPKLNYYKKQKCANCGYSWDYPFSNRGFMTDVQNLFYFEVHLCPHCNSVGFFITEVGDFELQIQNDANYKKILKDRCKVFSTVSKKETYKYLLYAYICEKKGDDLMCARAYYMANKVEKYQRDKYIESMLYNEVKDVELLRQSEEKEKEYLRKALFFMNRYVANNAKDIEANIMLAVLYKLARDNDSAIILLNKVMNMQVSQTQIKMVKEVLSMPLGYSNFYKADN